MESCETCANYNTVSCVWGENNKNKERKRIINDYNFDCWTSEEEKFMCELMCGVEENGNYE